MSDGPRPPGLGLWMCTALVLGNMIGSGVYLLPASLAPFGGISVVGWLVSATGAVCLALVFARLGAQMPKVGGPYAYAREGFGDFGGFWVAWSYWFSAWTTNAALAVAFVSYSTVFWPTLGSSPTAAAGAALATVWLLTAVNVRGIRAAGRVQLVSTILKVLPLLAVGTLGLFAFEPGHFRPFNAAASSPIVSLNATVTLTLWAFLGLETGTVPAADVRDASRTIPLATVLGTVIAAGIYILCTVAVMGIVPPGELASSTAPFADAAGGLWGSGARWFIGAGAAISCFGAVNGWTLIAGQIPRAAALDGLLPARFERLGRGGTPVFGLVVSSVLTTVLILMNYTRGLVGAFTFLILLATLATLMPYVFSSLTGLLIALRERDPPAATGRAMARVVISLAAFLFSIWAIAGAGTGTVFWGFLMMIAGLPVYVVMRWRRAA